jgi:enoyl-CoA hydratase/carnithine racemase
MRAMKHQVWTHLGLTVEQALDDSNVLMAASLREPDFKEGVASFLEKRPPDFRPVTD